jgi:O-antigen ligase
MAAIANVFNKTSLKELLFWVSTQLSFRRFLLFYSVLNIFFCESIFRYPQSFPYPSFVLYLYVFYFVCSAVWFFLFCLEQPPFSVFRVNGSHVIVFLFLLSAAVSLIINRSAIHDKTPFGQLAYLLMATSFAFMYAHVYSRSFLPRILDLIAFLGLLNALSYILLLAMGSFGPGTGEAVLFADRNFFARYLAIANSYFLIKILSKPDSSRKQDFYSIAGILIIFLGLLPLLSRGGYVVYFVSTIFVLVSSKSAANLKAAFVLGVVLIALFSSLILFRIHKDQMNVVNMSDIHRKTMLLTGLNMIRSRPLFGVGYGLAPLRESEYRDKRLPGMPNTTAIHDVFIAIGAEQGLIGLSFFLILNVSLFVQHFKRILKQPFQQMKYSVFCCSSIGIFMIDGLVLPTILYEGIYWIIIAVSMIALSERFEVTNDT